MALTRAEIQKNYKERKKLKEGQKVFGQATGRTSGGLTIYKAK